MALYAWIEQGTREIIYEKFRTDFLLGLIDLPEHHQPPTPSPQFAYNPFPYLPPELIVSILSQTSADSIPSLYETNHFFHIHIQIYKRQLIKIRCSRYPQQILSAYSSIHAIDFDTIHFTPTAWSTLSKFEQKANTCLALETFLPPNLILPGMPLGRFYRAFLRQWESRATMFFPREQWDEALLDRFHIYEDCSRSEICDIVHIQMLYRNVLARLPWSEIIPGDITTDIRIHWCLKSDMYRNVVDQIIGCGPEFIISLLSLSPDYVVHFLRQCITRFESVDAGQVKYCCFDDVMAKLLTRLDGGSQVATRWQEEESYFDVCAATSWFCEGNLRVLPFRN